MITFITPFLSGKRMLDIHLTSIRKYHPNDEILISSADASVKEITDKYNAILLVEDLFYYESVWSMINKASHDNLVICDHDTVFFNSFEPLVNKLNEVDVVAIEENIQHPTNGLYERLAPGYFDMTIMVVKKEKLLSVAPTWEEHPREYTMTGQNQEPHYGICDKMPKHYYLRPYHIDRYGLGNIIKDGDEVVAYHQWFGSWEKRPAFISEDPERQDKSYDSFKELKEAENNFMDDYPNIDFSQAIPIYGNS